MNTAPEPENEQTILWNGRAGHAWVESQGLLDTLFAPIEDLLADAAAELAPSRLLDVGCGTGATTIACARRLGSGADCLGVDISEPMIAAARSRASEAGVAARFLVTDAGRHEFAPAGFEMIASRFGVMFFDDPVRAFANLRRAARDSAALRCVVWRGAEENPFMTAAETAAAPLLPEMRVRDPDAPGQFAFADAKRVRRILEESGWSGIEIRPIDFPCAFPEAELEAYFTRFGPVGRVLDAADPLTRARVVEAVRAAFEPYVQAEEVRFTAACWMVAAEAG